MKELNYYELTTDLSEVYLEDSWVVEISEKDNTIDFRMEFVLTDKHRNYEAPKDGEQYCYKHGKLNFPNASEITWVQKNFKASMDAEGRVDYGNIDSFTFNNGKYHLLGSWGEVLIISDTPQISFADSI